MLNEKLIQNSVKLNEWSLGNEVLYDLCRKYPKNNTTDVIIAKIWLIGRAYSASIERRKNKAEINDDFYIKMSRAVNKSQIDIHFKDLRKIKEINLATLPLILRAHSRLTNIFFRITELEKRSLASKYLHFHFPHLYFIYDSRAWNAIQSLNSQYKESVRIDLKTNYDKRYFQFVCMCLSLQNSIRDKYRKNLSVRAIDNLLISLANKSERIKLKAIQF